MVNHPNRGKPSLWANPTPQMVREAREQTGLTQTEAGALVYSSLKAWQTWEDGTRRMHPGLWQLFNWKTKGRDDNE